MNNDLIDILKDVYSHSTEKIYITDHDFNILWHNGKNILSKTDSDVIKHIFSEKSLPLESGDYNVKYEGLQFACKIINYPECENGIYIMQIDSEDVMFSCLKNSVVKNYLINQTGTIREAVTGITFASNMLHKILEEADLYSDHRYLDVTMGNCYRLLRTVTNITELIRYTDENFEYNKIDLSMVINEFGKKCQELLGTSIEIKIVTEENLYIKADMERLISCLISMTILANGKNPENNVLTFRCEKIGNSVSVTVSPDRSGYDNFSRTFSVCHVLYDSDDVNSDLFVVSRFCRTFGGILYMSDSGEKRRSFSIRMPYCEDEEVPKELNSSVRPYPDDKFTKYHIGLSEIADIFYY